MSQYGILRAIPMSFYSKALYRDVAFNWGGKAFLYLLFILTLSWIAFTIQIQIAASQAYGYHSDRIVSQVPVMTIKNGTLSTPEAKPYVIKDPQSQENLVVIDTTGKFTTLQQANAGVLVTAQEVISQRKENEVRIDKFPETLNMVVDPQAIKEFIAKYIGFLWIPLFIVFLLGSFLYRIVQVLIYALFGRLFSALVGAQLSYSQVLQIVMVAITPVIIISTILEFFSISFDYQYLYYFLLSLLYMFYGVYANKPALPIVMTDSPQIKDKENL